MPERYRNAKIFTLRSPNSEKYYLGSTCLPLYKRLYQIKTKYNKWNESKDEKSFDQAYKIFQSGDAYVELYESFPCNNKEELKKRTGELLRQLKDQII
jgi:hypothetical protein